nr:hypothetical protein [uncultured Sphingomonas sp.]
MAEPKQPSEDAKQRRRLITLGEIIALAGLTISALALWNSWKSDKGDKPDVVVEQRTAIPLTLRGTVDKDGRIVRLTPAEPSHALDTVTITAMAPASGRADFGGEPVLTAETIEDWLPKSTPRQGSGSLNVMANAQYIESGENRTARQRYRITYRWVDGGLFGGKALRLTAISRS